MKEPSETENSREIDDRPPITQPTPIIITGGSPLTAISEVIHWDDWTNIDAHRKRHPLGNRKITRVRPWLFSVSGEGKWMTNAKPAYTGQLKLTIPVLDGVDFPVSMSFANRSDLIKESKVRGRFGFSFDVPRLLKAFKR